MSLYSMADLQHRCAVQNLTLAIMHMLPSALLTASAHKFQSDYGAKMPYDPTAWLPTLDPHVLPLRIQGSLPMVWLAPYRAGFPPAKHCTLSLAH